MLNRSLLNLTGMLLVTHLRPSDNSCGVPKSYTVDKIHMIAVFSMTSSGYWFDKAKQAFDRKRLVNELEICIAVRS